MTKKELVQTHKLYDAWLPEWEFYVRSYYGGKNYRDGDYLLKHPFESEPNYKRRKEIAYFYNYCQPITDIFVSHLNKPRHKRDFGALGENILFKKFLLDADYEGTSYKEFMKSVEKYASIYGRVTIVIDMPSMEVGTLAEAAELDIRPYCTIITPERVLDWKYIRLNSGRFVLDRIKIKEHEEEGSIQYRIWTRFGWELWEVKETETEAILLDLGTHDIGEVPVVNWYNKRGSERMLGQSDLQDIADINKNIYYLCSDAKEIIENTAFPMLAAATEQGGDEEKETGPRSIFEFDGELPNSKPFWLEPPHSSLEELREWINQDMTEIFRIANLGGMINVETSKQPWSGPGQEMQSNRLTAAMSQKADLAEEGEVSILKLVGKWLGVDFDGKIDYERDFAIRDITLALQNAMSAQSAKIDSVTFIKENQKKIVDGALPKLREDTRKVIYKEIDDAEVSIEPKTMDVINNTSSNNTRNDVRNN